MTPQEQTRVFLSRIYPWGGETGFRSIWMGWHKAGEAKPIFYGRNIDDIAAGEWLADHMGRRGQDIYACMSLQAERGEDKPGTTPRFTRASKHADKAISLNSFWLDVDVKPTGYATDMDALQGIIGFVQATGLPKPTMVLHTGGGFHVHWCMDEPVPAADWRPVADALKSMVLAHGMPIDAMLIADPARIMRVPGTYNFKNGGRREVKIAGPVLPTHDFQVFRSIIAKNHAIAAPQQVSQPSPNFANALAGAMSSAFVQAGVSGGEDLSKGVHLAESRSRPVDMEAVIRECPFFAEAASNGGASHGNPEWNITIFGSTFAQDDTGRDWAHALSKGWVGPKGETYDPVRVDKEYDRKVAEKARDARLGWPACSTIGRISPFANSICSGCQHFATPKMSPMKLGASDADLPDGYFREDDRIMRRLPPDEDGNPMSVVVFPAGMRDAFLEETGDDTILHATIVPPKGAMRMLSISAGVASNIHKTAEIYGRAGWPPLEAAKKWLKEFTVAWIKHLQDRRGAAARAHPYGWIFENGQPVGFSYAGRVYSASNQQQTRSPDAEVKKIYHPSGDAAEWRQAADFITGMGRMELDAILAASFGAPLMRFTGHHGAVLSAQSAESGVGKTSALRVAQAVWGQPTSGALQLTDTENSAMKRAGQVRHLPLFWDEVKGDVQANKFTTIAFQLAQGREKARLNADTSMRAHAEWHTLLVVASNERIAAHVGQDRSTPAGIFRVLEYEVPRVASTTPVSTASALVAKAEDNYGHAGAAYAEWLGLNPAKARGATQHMMQIFETLLAPKQDERFWIAACAVIVTGAGIAKRLGLASFDVQRLTDFLVRVVHANRAGKAASRADLSSPQAAGDLLQEFLADNPRFIIYTHAFPSGPGKPKLTLDGDWNHATVQVARVHYATQSNVIRISQNLLIDWCKGKKLVPPMVMDVLAKHFKGRTFRATLGAGTPYSNVGQETVLELDLNLAPAPLMGAGGTV